MSAGTVSRDDWNRYCIFEWLGGRSLIRESEGAQQELLSLHRRLLSLKVGRGGRSERERLRAGAVLQRALL